MPITQTLKNSITSGRIAHAYLFSGPRGVGKTTTARILAKALNCKNGPIPEPCDECTLCDEINRGSSVDVIEIDGASNNSVDDIRDLREKVHYVPAKGRYKVYIIDEVHMLSTQAFNALLKTLEEPPSHIVFILATTEAHKIPLTILSRCQRYDFRRISSQDIRIYLDKLLEQERGIKGDREASLRLIARCADGSLRDALSLMDQMISLSDGEIKLQQVLDLVSLVDRHIIEKLLRSLIEGKPGQAFIYIEKVIDHGHNLKHFVEQMLQYIRDVIIFKLANGDSKALDLSAEEAKEIATLANAISQEDLFRYFDILAKTAQRMRFSSQPRLILEMTLIRMAELPKLEALGNLIQKLELLENIKEMASVPQPASVSETYAQESITNAPVQAITANQIEPVSGMEQESVPATSTVLADPLSEDTNISVHAKHPSSLDEGKPHYDYNASPLPPIQKVEQNGLDWSKVVQQVKGKSIVFGSVLEHLQVNHQEGSTILELALKNDNPFYWQLIEDKKNQVILQAALTKVSGKSLEIKWAYPAGKGPEKKQPLPKKVKRHHPLDLINREPVIQMAMDIFSADIVKTHLAKDSNIDNNGSLNGEQKEQ